MTIGFADRLFSQLPTLHLPDAGGDALEMSGLDL